MSPPFCVPKADLVYWTTDQVFRFFDRERDDEGRPKPPQVGRSLSNRELHRIQLFHAGIHDPETVAKLWRERDGR